VFIDDPFEVITNNSLVQCTTGTCQYYCGSSSRVDGNSQWSFNDTVVSTTMTDDVYQMASDFSVDGEGVGLVVSSTGSPDEGVYTCSISDVDGNTESLRIDVFVTASKLSVVDCVVLAYNITTNVLRQCLMVGIA